ncbi:polyprenyl diphosphate synthase [Pelagibacteraceae bacterium]|nr:polyprenyl diphosphate synthase [Pelagibacteraceae bacterium]
MLNNLSHIAVILDGNKRWAKKNNHTNLHGYTKGFENIKNLVTYSLSKKISNLTLFTLSSENFKRSSINIIYDIIYNNFTKTFSELIEDKGVNVKIFGSRKNLPKKILEIFDSIEKSSSNNKKLNLNIAFNYGFKEEIKNVIQKALENKTNLNFDNENNINELFYLGSLSDPDILIRTGGYKRLSNFIMYNLTYTELFFTDTLWPDFSEKELNSIINQYSKIDRKYGL